MTAPAALFSVNSYAPQGTMFAGDVTPMVSSAGGNGSELIVQNIIGAMQRELGVDVLTRNATALDILRQRRVRSLVFVSDYAGSGDESLTYARSWLRNATVRSWRSLKLVQLHLVLFAASTTALRRIRASGLYDKVWVLHHGMDFASAPWGQGERRKIRALCERYARRAGEGQGWLGSEGLLVFEHTVPNNLPSILRQGKGPSRRPGGGWAPFFEFRTAPPDAMRDIVGYRPERDPERGLRALGQVRLAAAGVMRPHDRSELRMLVEVLAHIAGGRRYPEQLATALAVSVPTAEEIISQVRKWGLVDIHTRLTDAGWAELRAAKAKPRTVASGLQGSREHYYPVSLRESR